MKVMITFFVDELNLIKLTAYYTVFITNEVKLKIVSFVIYFHFLYNISEYEYNVRRKLFNSKSEGNNC